MRTGFRIEISWNCYTLYVIPHRLGLLVHVVLTLVTVIYHSGDVEGFKSTAITTMTSISVHEEWLEKSIDNEYIRFYRYDDFINSHFIGHGAFGVVFKATIATSDITVAYKLITNLDEDEFFKSFVNEVCNDA